MKYILTVVLLVTTNLTYAQSWQPLAYDSLKAGLEENPLKGFATIFNPDPSNSFPSTIRGRLFGLDTLMSGPNTFDWLAIDNFLDEQSSIGKHAYIQVNIDPAGGGTHMPDYLFPLVDTFYYDDPNPEGTDDLCPDWNDPDLMDAMLTFIDSFGVRYDDDPRIFTIHLGLYGMWGEWHIGDVEMVKPEYEMSDANKTLLANAYAAAFPNTLLLARYPENMPEPQDYGYSDGFFFSESIGDGDGTANYFHNILKASNADLNWKNLPISGEIDPAIQSTLWDNWPNIVGQDVTESMDSIHPTWFISHHHFTDQITEGTSEWDNSLRALREMGYSMYIDSSKITAVNGMPAIEVNIKNEGIAPFYGDWDAELAVLDDNNQITALGVTNWNLNIIQPDLKDNYRSFISTTDLDDGTYTFLLRVINPLESYATEGAPQFTFANAGQDQDTLGWLSLGEATLNGGAIGTPPIKVSGITLSQTVDTITVEETLQLVATVQPTNATNKAVTWTSSKPGTLEVDDDGLVTPGREYGTSVIRGYTQDGGFVAECLVTLEPIFVDIPSVVEAEDFIDMKGVQNGSCCDGIKFLEYIDNNDWMDYGVVVSEDAIWQIDFRVSSDNANGEISIITESNDTLLVRNIDNASWWEDYQIKTSDPFLLPQGEQILRLAASSGGFNIDWLEFKVLPDSYTFLGTLNNQYLEPQNWESGAVPPNRYPGTISIAADCVVPVGYNLFIPENGTLTVNSTAVLTIE